MSETYACELEDDAPESRRQGPVPPCRIRRSQGKAKRPLRHAIGYIVDRVVDVPPVDIPPSEELQFDDVFVTFGFDPNANANTVSCSSSDSNDGRRESHESLCGYLRVKATSRLAGVSLRNKKTSSNKWYWFVYAENTGKLFYFRTNHDHDEKAVDKTLVGPVQAPLGEINIANATFLLRVHDDEGVEGVGDDDGSRGRSFTISVPDCNYELEATDRETACYWIQELQKRRRKFSKRKAAHMRSHGVHLSISHFGKSSSGLLREQCSAECSEGIEDDIPPLLVPHVAAPGESVGEEAHRPSDVCSAAHILSGSRTRTCSGVSGTRPFKSSSSFDDLPTSPTCERTAVALRHDAPRSFNLRKSFRKSLLLPFAQIQASNERCGKCDKLALEVSRLEESFVDSSIQLRAANEMISFLQRQLDLACRQKESVMKIRSDPNMECHMKLAIDKDIELAEMTHKLDAVNRDLEDVKLEYVALKRELRDVNTYNQEVIRLKNQIVNQLTEQLTSLEMERAAWKSQPAFSANAAFPSPTVAISYSKFDRLSDELQAYRLQNSFLNSEILQLNLLRNEGEEREECIKMKCLEWEAKFCAIQSKYLVLLNEYQTSKHDPGTGSSTSASRLLHDAIHDTSGPDYLSLDKVLSSDARYNIYGFSKISACCSHSLLRGAYVVGQRSNEIMGTIKGGDVEGWVSKWDSYVASLGKQNLQQSAVLKDLLRSGIPFYHRSRIWKGCVELHVKQLRDSKPKNYYDQLLASVGHGAVTDIALKQIELDLLRTLPHNKHFENANSDGIPKLRRILSAYSQHNQGVGYCQGLNRLVAVALLFMSEEDAFWALVAIVEFLMVPDYYSHDLLGAQVDQLVLKELLFEKIPRLHAHFENSATDVSLFTFNWMMCIFVDCLPVETYLSIWDSFLFEGNKVLFRFALAILKMAEEECLKADDNLAVSGVLRNYSETLTDFRRLSQIAFHELNPFPRRAVANKRDQYTMVVKAEVDKINERRATYRTLSLQPKASFKYIPSARD